MKKGMSTGLSYLWKLKGPGNTEAFSYQCEYSHVNTQQSFLLSLKIPRLHVGDLVGREPFLHRRIHLVHREG
jgi:hypothetical protein